MKKQYLSFGLFSNLRGLEIGAERAGFHNIFSTDIEQKSADAFPLLSSNRDEVFLKSNVKDLSYPVILKALASKNQTLKVGEIDLLVGGPPCFYITLLNTNHRSVFHWMNMLMFDMIRLVDELQPKVVVMEQVPAVLSKGIAPFYNLLKMYMDSLNYNWDVKVLNAANYGCYQSRKRAIFMMVRKDLKTLPSFPKPGEINLSKQSAYAVSGVEMFRDKSHIKKDQTKVKFRSGKAAPIGTMTSQALHIYRGGKWDIMGIEERKKFAHMDFVDLSPVLPVTDYKDMLGNMVLPPFAEALAKHVLEEILKKSEIVANQEAA
ncbi:DNA cytosine methyltransferase [Flavobacterium sp. UBA7682]|uniref:DNA cytosine methyltransferase n=1 Tax=Flavobacterium sp. UBA7682 TaxID=1946560 RepID=UPI0025BCF858|nr:DNA cytosine methyltransferase [Flavobacterium sp. UBA7682]